MLLLMMTLMRLEQLFDVRHTLRMMSHEFEENTQRQVAAGQGSIRYPVGGRAELSCFKLVESALPVSD